MVRERETGRQAGSSYGAGLGVMHGRVAKAARRDPAPQWINSEDDAENGMVINMAISDDDEGTGEEQAEGTVRPGAAISISYRCLSRESKKKLEELLFSWIEWHGRHANQGPAGAHDRGEGLQAGVIEVSEAAQGTCGNLVWVDRPRVEKAGTPAGAVQNTLTPQKEPCYESKYLAEHKVPLYDRACNSLGSYKEAPRGSEPSGPRPVERAMNRCFNCGSYFHSLAQCKDPRDNERIAQAREAFDGGPQRGPGGGTPSRYFLAKTGEFVGLTPSKLSQETCDAIGIRPGDPPPWLLRMNVLGPPPAWGGGPSALARHKDDDFIIFDGDGQPESHIKLNERETSKEQISFPGVNSPVPISAADSSMWGRALGQAPSSLDWEFASKWQELRAEVGEAVAEERYSPSMEQKQRWSPGQQLQPEPLGGYGGPRPLQAARSNLPVAFNDSPAVQPQPWRERKFF